MTHIDLFSGIGGFALAAEWAWGEDHDVLAFCEIDPYCQQVLKRHWPEAPIISDVRQLYRSILAYSESGGRRIRERIDIGASTGEVDASGGASENERIYLLTGGFPCQPFSHAGQRGGAEDDRFLWPEMVRCIQEFKPRWVVGENVDGIYSMEDVFEQVHTDLEGAGYEVQAIRIPACAVGAHHRRDRWWFVAHANGERRQQKPRSSHGYETPNEGRASQFDYQSASNGKSWSEPMARANESRPQGRDGGELPQRRGERPAWAGGSWPQPWPVSEWQDVADAEGTNDGRPGTGSQKRAKASHGDRATSKLAELEQIWPPVGEFCRVASRLSSGLEFNRRGLTHEQALRIVWGREVQESETVLFEQMLRAMDDESEPVSHASCIKKAGTETHHIVEAMRGLWVNRSTINAASSRPRRCIACGNPMLQVSRKSRPSGWIQEGEETKRLCDLRESVHAISQQETQDMQPRVSERDRQEQCHETMGPIYVPVRNRTDRLKALGNAIVPEVAYEIFRAIKQIDG